MLRDGNKFVLAIREVLIEDSGIFTCRATNPAGVAECSAELFVEGDSFSVRSLSQWKYWGIIFRPVYAGFWGDRAGENVAVF